MNDNIDPNRSQKRRLEPEGHEETANKRQLR
jgi:hypothetical protein